MGTEHVLSHDNSSPAEQDRIDDRRISVSTLIPAPCSISDMKPPLMIFE
ncbi:MAG: hypothetical protein MJ234_04805 [bacterium]|nr:hypothetical protein [bacterium]